MQGGVGKRVGLRRWELKTQKKRLSGQGLGVLACGVGCWASASRLVTITVPLSNELPLCISVFSQNTERINLLEKLNKITYEST